MVLSNYEYRQRPFLTANEVGLPQPKQNTYTPLQQHPLYANAMQTLGARINEITISRKNKDILKGYVLQRQFFRYINVTNALRGPLWLDAHIPEQEKINALKFLRTQFSNWRWRFLSMMPEMVDTAANRKIMHAAGFRRIITGSSTILLDLSQSIEDLRKQLDGNWRNQLKKAEAENISISFGGSKPKHYNWLLEMEKEQQRSKGYNALPIGFVNAYHNAAQALNYSKQNIMSATAIEKGNKTAGALFLLHGNSATYHIGWVGERGRELNAQNRVLFESIIALREHGIQWLDMGGIDTGSGAGIARFKLGMGSAPQTLVGTYI